MLDSRRNSSRVICADSEGGITIRELPNTVISQQKNVLNRESRMVFPRIET